VEDTVSSEHKSKSDKSTSGKDSECYIKDDWEDEELLPTAQASLRKTRNGCQVDKVH